MERNPPIAFASLMLVALLACACSPQAPVPGTTDADAGATATTAAAPAAASPTPAMENDTATTLAQPGVQPADNGADARAFAGTYAGTLPCADCPGIDETLVLAADGGFVLTDTYRDRPGSASVVPGSWTIEDGGKRIRLDPGSKDAVDKFYEVDGADLRLLDGDGKRLGNGLPDRLRRDAS